MLLVTGATGLNGGAVVRRLSSRGVPVRALVRSRDRAVELAKLPNVEIVEGDMLRPESLAAPVLAGVRALLIASSDPRMAVAQCNFFHAARLAGVQHVVILSG